MTDRARLRALATTLRDDLGLAGEWAWFGNMRFGGPHLSTKRSGRRTVLWFARKGMSSAQPMFPQHRKGDPAAWTTMVKADEVPIYEVAPLATSRTDPQVYREDIIGLRNPVAEYLAAVDADTVLGLLDEIDTLRELLRRVVMDNDLGGECFGDCACSSAAAKRMVNA